MHISFWKKMVALVQIFTFVLVIVNTFLIVFFHWPVSLEAKSEESIEKTAQTLSSTEDLVAQVIPADGVEIDLRWSDLGQQLVTNGVIDMERLNTVYADRGGVPPFMTSMLTENSTDNIRFTEDTASSLLTLFWAFGLSNENAILTEGEMMDPDYGGADQFASTGGWSLSSGDVMDHYAKHSFISLTEDEQILVQKVADGVYRPCCGNATSFPDCNHGMAMLGMLQLLAARGADEEELYNAAFAANRYWFPDTYVNIARFLELRGTSFAEATPQALLAADFSSRKGYQTILSQLPSSESTQRGGGCSV